MYVLCLSVTAGINVYISEDQWILDSCSAGFRELLVFVAVNMGAFKMFICIAVICKSSPLTRATWSRAGLHRVSLCCITAPPSVIITRIPLFTITVVINFVFVCPIRKRQCWSVFRGINWSRFGVIRTCRNREGKRHRRQFAVTINSWAQLFNTSCQSLKETLCVALWPRLLSCARVVDWILLGKLKLLKRSTGAEQQLLKVLSIPMLFHSYGVVFLCKCWATDLWAVVIFRNTRCDFCFSPLYVLAMATIFKGPSSNGRGNTCSNKEQMHAPRLFIVSFYYRTFQRRFPDIWLNCILYTKYHWMYVIALLSPVYCCSGRPHCHQCLLVFLQNFKQLQFCLLFFLRKV